MLANNHPLNRYSDVYTLKSRSSNHTSKEMRKLVYLSYRNAVEDNIYNEFMQDQVYITFDNSSKMKILLMS